MDRLVRDGSRRAVPGGSVVGGCLHRYHVARVRIVRQRSGMSGRRTVLYGVLAVVVVMLAAIAWRVLPLLTGPALPTGATRLAIVTDRPSLVMGCATALLAPAA